MKILSKLKELYTNYLLITLTLCLIKLAPSILLSLVNPYVSIRLNELESSGILRGVALASNTVFAFLTCMFFGHYSEWSNLGRNVIITCGILITAASSIFTGLATTWYYFFIILSISGIGTAATMSCAYSIILDVIPEDLIVLALTCVEFFEAMGWTISPAIVGGALEKNNKVIFLPFLGVGLAQAAIAVFSAVVLHFKLKPIKKKLQEEIVYEDTTLAERLKILFSSRATYIIIVVNGATCFCFRFFSSVFSLYLGELKHIKIFYSVPAAPIAVLSIPLIKRYVSATDFVTYTLPILAPLYFFLGDSPIDKRLLGEDGYTAVIYILIFFRDFFFWTSYVICNVVVMERVAMKYPKIELKGLCGAIFVFSFNFGDSVGLLLGNYFNDLYGYNVIVHISTGVLFAAFVIVCSIRYIKYNKCIN